MLVGGEFRGAADGATRAIHSARDGSVLVDLAWAQPADADAAVAAAREAFDQGRWPRMHARERGEILQEFAAPGRGPPGRDRAVDQPRDGQADPHRVRDRTPGADPLPALLRRTRRQGVRRHPAHDRGRAGPGDPGAGRRGRRGRAVELPVDARRLEVRAGAGRRLHGGAQDRRAVAAVDAAGGRARGARPGCRPGCSTCSAATGPRSVGDSASIRTSTC